MVQAAKFPAGEALLSSQTQLNPAAGERLLGALLQLKSGRASENHWNQLAPHRLAASKGAARTFIN